ncbi:MAG TPA: hypothetical protein PLL71_08620 [Agriterribacter sp.]|nr:hypothetical protein [Agriterribacter sp.]HRQ49447.1 hypothetical protein [Agriterribacter sp.]
MNRPIKIKPLHPYEYKQNDTTIEGQFMGRVLFKYYYVENYSDHDSIEIKRFVFDRLPADYKTYSQFQVLLFRKTNILNDKYVDRDEDELAWHSKDQLFRFEWNNGEFLGYFEYKDGGCINCTEVEVDMK